MYEKRIKIIKFTKPKKVSMIQRPKFTCSQISEYSYIGSGLIKIFPIIFPLCKISIFLDGMVLEKLPKIF